MFIDECSAEVPQPNPVAALGSYEALLARDDIDAVYLPLPTGIRKEWVIRAAEAGKHVLCEKPIATNASDAKEMIDACASAGVQFMDGVMFEHSSRLPALRKRLDDEKVIGRLRRMNTHFSFCGDDSFQESNIRADHDLEPHGALGDLGWYCIRFMLWVMNDQLPTHVSARTLQSIGNDSSDGQVPGEMSAELRFGDDVSGSFYCSFQTENQQTALLSGDKGYVFLDDFVLPFYNAQIGWSEHAHQLEIDNCRWNFNRRSSGQAVDEYASGEANAQEVNMIRNFGEMAISGELDPRHAEIALKTQQVLDACRRSEIDDGKMIAL
tara:strand:+ start:6621 stop:7592 length:972 start_codon:yes stop_codon:yes gene_type:complete